MIGFFALLGSLWMAPPCEAGFCSCVPLDVAAAVQAADAVFVGSVVSVRDTMVDRGSTHGAWRMRRVTLRVVRSWKGAETRDAVVLTGMGDGDCGFPFERGQSYLVYAHSRDPGVLSASICGRTRSLQRAAADLEELGTPVRRRSR
jgi:hypothetical protein